MSQCIFCLRESTTEGVPVRLTDEHVFPAALGGSLTVTNASCDFCNHGRSNLEQIVARELAPLRMLLQIPDRYGKVPHAIATIVTPEKQYQGRVRGDGTVQLKPLVTQEINDLGQREFLHQFVTQKQKERLLELAKSKGIELIETGPGEPVTAEVHIGGDLIEIGSDAGLRTAAKIAYVGLAYLAGVGTALSQAFHEVRLYIRNGKPEGVSRLFVNKTYLAACQQGPHQHSIAIAARHDTSRVDAIVRLFGELCYFVVLSDHYEGADFCKTLVYDAHRGEINDILYTHHEAELLQARDITTSNLTEWDNLAASGRNLCEFIERVVEEKRQRDRASTK